MVAIVGKSTIIEQTKQSFRLKERERENFFFIIDTVENNFKTMDKLTGFRYTPLPADSPYVKPFRMYYTQNGMEKSWDMLKVHDSVAIIILNKTRNKLVMVRQFRPGKNDRTCDLPTKKNPFQMISFLCVFIYSFQLFIIR